MVQSRGDEHYGSVSPDAEIFGKVGVDLIEEQALLSSPGMTSANLEVEQPQTSAQKKVTLLPLVFMTFFAVSGGTYGVEDAVRVAYPLITLLTFIIMPWFWCLPTALMTAELSTAMPDNSGFIGWTERAFGKVMAFQVGFWSFLCTVFDNALYPVMFHDYLAGLIGIEFSFVEKFFIGIGVIIFIMILNLIGVDVVGKLSVVFAILVISPFVCMTIAGISLGYLKPAVWKILPPTAPTLDDWGLFLSVMLWNTNGWDNMGSIAADVRNPKRTFPRGMILAVLLVILVYIIPVAVAVVTAQLGGKLGSGLRIFMGVGAMFSALGIFSVNLCTSSQALSFLGDPGLLDAPALGYQSRYNTPYVSIILMSVLVAFASYLPFQSLVQIDVLLGGLRLIAEFAVLIFLRRSVKGKDMERPYKVPIKNLVLLTLFSLPPCVLSVLIIITCSHTTQYLSIGCVALGLVIYYANKLIRKRFCAHHRIFRFVDSVDLSSDDVFDDSTPLTPHML